MPIRLVDYDPGWPTLFLRRRTAIAAFLCRPADIHHIGSTSILGLCAKPKLDIDAVLTTADDRLFATERLMEAGYTFHGDPYGADRWIFTKDETPYGTRLYLCLLDNPAHRDRILFRDYLRAHPEAARDYAALKRRLVIEANGNWDHYTGGKSDFVADVLRCALAERS
ncbi:MULTISPECIES: GrpB family protein [unclassified Rhizobium]|uniref:GrpB family protein n=1 Tax=unclassified Rhizobium TaxID=2613769 RepID=UPI000CDF4AA8|nr:MULTISPECIES: GrpB family protein [Rhizobium]AVA21211.1 glutamate-rich protein GrpB [Rhizobium sp. NXC24]MDK4743536.1 GrpB family protein [Rhizobium sp. CNPSo 3464]UWU22383.1 GrpB family protein [Rhizobium tropici]